MHILFIDTETYSPIPIKHGLFRYVEQVELLIVSYALDNEPVQVWDCANTMIPYHKTQDTTRFNSLNVRRYSNPLLPIKLLTYLNMPDTIVCAHNSQFDRLVLYKTLGFWHPRWHDTMVQAYRHSLPGSLSELCTIFKLPSDKAKLQDGCRLINLFCKPLGKNMKLIRATKQTHPKDWQRFLHYAANDIEAMRELLKLMPNYNETEYERNVFLLDQTINARGFKVDTDLAEKAIKAIESEKKISDAKCKELTNTIESTNQRDKLLAFILDYYGVALPNMQANTIRRRIEDPDLPPEVKQLLSIRLQMAKTSTTKFKILLNSVNEDHRLRGTLVYCGASRTGRFSGRLFQPHNLPRPVFKQYLIDAGIVALKAECTSLFFDRPSDICSSILRGLITADVGKKLVVSDYSSIEGRVLAWLAGERWKVEAYDQYDKGFGHDMYVTTYAATFENDPNTVTKQQRQIGKVLELALGFGGGVGAFLTFAKAYQIDLDVLTELPMPAYIRKKAVNYYNYLVENDDPILELLPMQTFIACDSIKRMWRETNSAIAGYWVSLQDAVLNAINSDISTKLLRGVCIEKKGAWLRIRLPSGRYLCYPGIHKDVNGNIKYWGKNQYTRKWCKLKTYGGKLSENITQAVARDVLINGMLEAEKAKYPIILTVHDELITETPDTEHYTHSQLSKIMTRKTEWMKDLPLAAEGYESYRYKK